MAEFYKIFLFLNYGLLLSIVFLTCWKFKILTQKEKQYAYYIVFLFLIELSNLMLAYFFEATDTSFLYPYYIAGEFFLLTGLFIGKLNLPKIVSGAAILLTAAFLVISNIPKIAFNNDVAKVVSNIIIICFAGFTLLRQIKNGKSSNNFTLIDACIFFYYSVSVFIFVVQRQITSLSEDDYYLLFGTNNVLSSILYSSFIYTLLRLKK